MKKSIDIILSGSEEELARVFSYPDELNNSGLSSLAEFLSFKFNQTLLRDRHYGAWAQVVIQEGEYVLKLSSPHHDMHVYKDLIEDYLNAAKTGLKICEDNNCEVNGMKFMVPFGLAKANTKSVQLLHFPPMETFVYKDYLFSPTNRRWENLLVYNKLRGVNFHALETIVDCVPLAAPGGASDEIAPFNYTFTPYVKEMLRARLDCTTGITQPIIAYGGPVMGWLESAYPDQTGDKLEVLSLVELHLFGDDTRTYLLCANHPSKYLYYTSQPYSEEKKDILTQDLIAAGWQARMAYHPDEDPWKVLDELKTHWTDNPELMRIMKLEDEEFNFKLK